MKITFPFLKLLLCAILFFMGQMVVAQTTSYDAEVQGRVYRKVSGDSLQLRTRAKSKSGVKKGTAKIDSLQYSPRQYMLGERVIMRGDSGRDVRSLANILIKKLYMDEAGVVYTSGGGVLYEGELVKAVIRFQRLNGFHEDGIVGKELIKALRKRTTTGK